MLLILCHLLSTGQTICNIAVGDTILLQIRLQITKDPWVCSDLIDLVCTKLLCINTKRFIGWSQYVCHTMPSKIEISVQNCTHFSVKHRFVKVKISTIHVYLKTIRYMFSHRFYPSMHTLPQYVFNIGIMHSKKKGVDGLYLY